MTYIYIAMAADLIHHGHINLINNARKYGKIIVGLLTDDAIKSYKRIPIVSFENRKKVLEGLKYIDTIIPQYTLDYTDNLELLKPNYVMHGDDWKNGPQKETRNKVINVLKQWNGELIEIPYTKNISTTELINKISDKST